MTTMLPFWFSDALKKEEKTKINKLKNDLHTDICIVGGGYTGLWTAIQLKKKQPSLNIAIIDKGLCGSGASGRNGGCMLPVSPKFSAMKKIVGEADAILMVKATEQALFEIKYFCNENNIDAQIRLDGNLYTATNKAQIGRFEAVVKDLERKGINNWERWLKKKVQKHSGSQKNIDGYFSPLSGSLHPGLLVRGLKKIAEKKGVQIFENTPMIKIEENKKVVVQTKRGAITSNKVVMAINVWMPQYFPSLSRAVVLVSSDMIITDPIPEQLDQIGFTDGKVILDTRLFTHYYRTTIDGRLMLGKGGNLFSFNNKVIQAYDEASRYEELLKNSFDRFFPSLCSVPFMQSWNGPSERTKTGFPFFGRLKDKSNIVYGFGYSGNGILPTYVGGKILSSMVLDEDNEWTRSSFCKGPLGLFPPEPFRWIGAITIRNAVMRKETAEDMGLRPWWIDAKLAQLATSVGRLDKSSY